MSRTGKIPVAIPDGSTASLADRVLTIAGPKGKAEIEISPLVAVTVDEASRQIRVTPCAGEIGPKQARPQRAMWGTTRRLIANAVLGVTEGYTRQLQIVGVGYGARIERDRLLLRCGFANEVGMTIPEGLTVDPPEPGNLMITGVGQLPCTTLTLRCTDRQVLGEFAASVRRLRPPEPYKGKGIRYIDEEVKRKAGKALAAGAS